MCDHIHLHKKKLKKKKKKIVKCTFNKKTLYKLQDSHHSGK